MSKEKQKEFIAKKKVYHKPVLQKYGTFAEYTKGNINGTGQPDGGQYYGAPTRS